MKGHLVLLVAMVAPMLVCNAQNADGGVSALTGVQASQVAKILRQHNVMMEYCGCCEVPAMSCVEIKKVTSDTVGVTVMGVNIETGEQYVKRIDVAETWVPQLAGGAISKMQCVGQMAKVNCDPCTNPSVPSGEVGKKMLALELDGLMEATGKTPKDGKFDLKNSNRDLEAAKKIRTIKGDKQLSKSLQKEPQKLRRDDVQLKKIPRNTEE